MSYTDIIATVHHSNVTASLRHLSTLLHHKAIIVEHQKRMLYTSYLSRLAKVADQLSDFRVFGFSTTPLTVP